ncbi:MAG: hypothetical protein I8H90_22535 [Burkholderiales bacterium]|nr:hypothetical protein [Burkholderiales bacterium]
MLYNVATDHGNARIATDFSSTGATAIVEWGGLTRLGTITYMFAGPIDLKASDGTSTEVIARLAASHFERTASPIDGAKLYFKIADIEPNKALRLIELS